MRIALSALVLVVGAGCARVGEVTVRDQAAAEFACAEYALTVVEVGPDVYRATGCGQELIYACRPARAATVGDDDGDSPAVVCARSLR